MRKGRIYGYQQLEQSDCGITCVRIIARYFGYRYTPAFLRGLSDSSRLGISIKDMTQTFAGIGFRAIPVRIGIDKLSEMPLPAILYWNQNHFIVLYRISKGRYHIVDPGSGKTSFRRSDIETYWLSGSNTGLAILAEPDPEAKPVECPREKSVSAVATLLRLFRQCLGKNRRPFAAVMLLSLISMCADIAMPLIFQQTVDTGISTGDIGLVWLLALMQVMIFIGNFMSSAALQYVITRLGLSLGISMMNEYLSRLLSMSMSFFARKVSSDLIQKIHDQERIKDFMVSMPGMLFTTALSMIVFSAMLAYYCLPALLIMTGATLLGIMWNNVFLRHTREIDFSRFSALSKSRNHVYEIVNGIAEIKINGAEEMRLGVWRRLQLKIRDLSVRALKIELLSSGGTSLITKLQDVCITGICATMVIRGEMTIGMMMTVGYITGRLAIPFSNGKHVPKRPENHDGCGARGRSDEPHSGASRRYGLHAGGRHNAQKRMVQISGVTKPRCAPPRVAHHQGRLHNSNSRRQRRGQDHADKNNTRPFYASHRRGGNRGTPPYSRQCRSMDEKLRRSDAGWHNIFRHDII